MRKRLKQMRKTAAFLLAVVMTAGGIPSGMLTAFAAETPPAASGSTDSEKTAGTLISAARTWGNPGGQAKLTLSMENNPGIVGLTLQIIYDTAVMSVAKAERQGRQHPVYAAEQRKQLCLERRFREAR